MRRRVGGEMPPEKDFFKSAQASYSDTPPQSLDGFNLIVSTPTLKVYLKDKTILVGVRGTKVTDKQDLIADARIALNLLKHSNRYKRDKEVFDKIIKQYPPQDYEYYLSGHSLGGAIDNQLKYDYPFIKNAVEYNPAFQPKDLFYSQGKDIKRLYTDKDALYNLGGKLFTNKQVIPAKSSIGNSYIDGISGHILSNFAELYNVSGGEELSREEEEKLIGKDLSKHINFSNLNPNAREYRQPRRKQEAFMFPTIEDYENYYNEQKLRNPNYTIYSDKSVIHPTLYQMQQSRRGKGSGSKNAGFIKMLYAKRVLKRKPEDYPTRDKKAPKKFLIKKIRNPSSHLNKKFGVAETIQRANIPLNRPFNKGERKNLSANELKELRHLELERKHKSLANKEGVSLEEYYNRHPKVKR